MNTIAWRRPVRPSLEERKVEVKRTIAVGMAGWNGGASFLGEHLALIDGLGLPQAEAGPWRERLKKEWDEKVASREPANDEEGPETDPALNRPEEPKSKLKGAELLINPKVGRKVSTETIQRAMVSFNPIRNPFSQNGFENSRKALELMQFDCALDVFHNKPVIRGEYAWLGGDGFADLDNVVLRLRETVLEDLGFDPTSKGMFDALQARCLNHCFDPLLDYLTGLQWDGKPRLDDWLMHYAQAEDTPLNRAFGRKTLIAAVRRALHAGCKFDYLLVLEGDQGIGKSTLVNILAGGDDFYSDKPIIGLETREQQEAIQGVWIYEIGELEGLHKADLNWMKGFLSRTHDKARPAFGRSVVNRARRVIFIGTTNDPTYLRDTTGNRRWWPVKLHGAIDLDAVKRDRNQLWAEAVVAEATGEPLVIPQELWGAAAVEQAARMEVDAWLEPIMERLFKLETKRVNSEGKFWTDCVDKQCIPEFRVTTNFLLGEVLCIGDSLRTTVHSQRLAGVMRTLGWKLATYPIKVGKSQKNYRAYTKPQTPEQE